MYIYDPKSITHADNKLYMYSTHIKGLCINARHVFNFSINNNINTGLSVPLFCEVMVRLYKNVFKRYEKVNQEELLKKQSRYMLDLLRICKNTNYRVNIRRFLHELDTYESFSQFNY